MMSDRGTLEICNGGGIAMSTTRRVQRLSGAFVLTVIGVIAEGIPDDIRIDTLQQYNSLPFHVNQYGEVVHYGFPSRRGPIIESVKLHAKASAHSEDRIARHGFLTLYDQAQATILLCHGFMCDKFDAGMLRSIFPRGRFNFMTFDFRAHGDGVEGQYCTLGHDEKYDVIAAARFLRAHEKTKDKPLLVYGFSMGAVAAIEAQAKHPGLFDAMVLDCPFESTENLLKRCLEGIKFSVFGYAFGIPGRSLLQKYVFHPYVQSFVKLILRAVAHFDPKKIDVMAYPVYPVTSVKKITVPCFFISCKNDERVSVDAIQEIFDRTASTYKQLWITNGRRHFDSYFYNPEQYTDRVRRFVARYLSGAMQQETKSLVIRDQDDFVVCQECHNRPYLDNNV